MRTCLLMLLALLLIAFPVKAVDKDLLLYLSFDEEGKVAKGGTIFGDVKWVEGKFGKTLELH